MSMGLPPHLAVKEIVEAVKRRKWDNVAVNGDPGFRRAVAWAMAAADPPIEILDSRLTPGERESVRPASGGFRP